MAQRRSLSRLAVNLLPLWGRHLIAAVASLFILRLVARRLGAELYGAWALLGTTSFLVGLSDLGLSVSLMRVAARLDNDATRRLIRLTFLVVWLVGPCFCAIGYALLLRPSNASASLQADLDVAAPVALAAGLVGTLGAPLRAFLLIRGAFKPLTWARTSASVVQVAVTFASLTLCRALIAPSVGLLASALVECAVLVSASRQIDPLLPLHPAWPEAPAEVREAFRQGAAAFAINVGVFAALRADVFILNARLPLAAVGAYQVASRAVDQAFSFAKQTSGSLLHRLSDPDRRAEALRLGTALLGGLVSSGMVALALNGSQLLVWWVGPVALQPIAVVATSLLGAAAILAASEEIAAATLTVSGDTNWQVARPMLLGHGLNILLSLAGARAFGAWAVAGGTLCGNLVITVLVWRRARRLLQWQGVDVLRALAPLATAFLLAVGAGWALQPLSAQGALASAFTCVLVTALGSGAALFVWSRGDPLRLPGELHAAEEEAF